MKNLIKRVRETEVQTCKVCGEKYYVEHIYYPSKLDEKRKSFYMCPHCESQESAVMVSVLGDEDVDTVKA